jgi:type VI protein secretion system component VasK
MPWESLAKWGAIAFVVLAALGFLYWRWEALAKGAGAYKREKRRAARVAASERRRAKARTKRVSVRDLLHFARRKSRAAKRSRKPQT